MIPRKLYKGLMANQTVLTAAGPGQVIITVLLAVLSACSQHDALHESGVTNAKSADIATVRVAIANRENLTHNVTLTAEFRPFQEVDVMAKVAGYVKKINVDVGIASKKAQLLATLEIPEMADDRAPRQSCGRAQPGGSRARQDELQRFRNRTEHRASLLYAT